MMSKKKRPAGGNRNRPQRIKISFFSLTRINGERKLVTMNSAGGDENIDYAV